MKVGFVQSIAAVLVGTGLALAQSPAKPGKSVVAQTAAAEPSSSAPGTFQYHSPLVPSGPVEPTMAAASDCNGAGCGNGIADCCAHPSYCFYASAEFLLLNFRDPSLPVLTSAVPVGLVQVNPQNTVNGVLQPPMANFIPVSILSTPGIPAGNALDTGDHSGVRFTAGFYLDPCQRLGFEVSAFEIERRSLNFTNTTGTSVNVFNVDTGLVQNNFVLTPAAVNAPSMLSLVNSTPLVFPRQSSTFLIGSVSTELRGGEVNVRGSCGEVGCVSFNGLVGVRYLDFRELLAVSNSVLLSQIPGVPDPGPGFPSVISFTTNDVIRTKNRFTAPQIGLEVDTLVGGFFFNAKGKFAAGAMRQEVTILGTTTIVGSPNPVTNFPGGLLTGPGDGGEQGRTRFAVVPEINLKVGYQFGNCLRVFAGYDALYLQHVARPAGQSSLSSVQTTLTVANSSTQINVQQPNFRLTDQDVWTQGFSTGIEFRY